MEHSMFTCQLNTMTILHRILLCGTWAVGLKPAVAQSPDQSALLLLQMSQKRRHYASLRMFRYSKTKT